jgi:2-polyprenyl-6-methoxyphenol hydroxylase-like FAD-dependent oxidoreductase
MKASFDAVIVGAGPAGSTASILLAKAGWRVALVEKQPFPRRKVCGECLGATNLPLLQSLGVGEAFARAAGPELLQVALLQGNRSVVADLPPAGEGPGRWGRALGRETLDTMLLEQAKLSGVQVMQPWSLQAFKGGAGNWQCEVSDKTSPTTLTLHSAVAIDAHGSWEALPSERTHPFCSGADLLAFKANFTGASLKTGLLPLLSFAGGYGGMVVADQGVMTLACCVRRDQLAALRRASPGANAGDTVELMLRQACVGVRVALETASRVGPWLAAGPLQPGIRLRPDDQLFRIGNAAAEAHPVIGEGMSMAFQSAWLLCEHLKTSKDRASLADRAWQHSIGQAYATDWHRQFGPRLRLAAAFAHLAMRPALASPVMSLIRFWPGLVSLGANWGGKTSFPTLTRRSS